MGSFCNKFSKANSRLITQICVYTGLTGSYTGSCGLEPSLLSHSSSLLWFLTCCQIQNYFTYFFLNFFGQNFGIHESATVHCCLSILMLVEILPHNLCGMHWAEVLGGTERSLLQREMDVREITRSLLHWADHHNTATPTALPARLFVALSLLHSDVFFFLWHWATGPICAAAHRESS